jgi:ubiquinone biosynthesis protein
MYLMSNLERSNRSASESESNAGRVKDILGVAVRYGLADYVESIPVPGGRALLEAVADSKFAEEPKEVRVRLALTELGPTFIKIGQLLATRVDVVGPELARELSSLHSNTPADPPEVVTATVERELGRPLLDIFTTFDPVAFASASIAQVHLATLWSGELVAVKVQKAGIQEKIASDLSVMESLAELAEKHSETYRDWHLTRLVEEFKRTILQELDFYRELRNIETFQRNFEGDPTVHFPRTWPEYSSRRVLTMGHLEGPLGTNIEALESSGIDMTDFAQKGARVFLEMVFRDGFYHADPHPGNLMMLPGGVIGILDCGMVGRVDEGLRDDLESLVAGISDGDTDTLTNSIWTQTKGQPEEAKDELRNEIANLLAESKLPIGRMDISVILNGVLAIFRKYRVTPRPGLTQLIRMLVILDGTARRLSPEFSLDSIMEPYESQSIRRRLNPERIMKRLQRSFIEWDKFIQTLPGELTSTMQRIKTGEFRVGLEHRHLDSVVNRLVLGILTSSLILGSSLLWSMKAPPLLSDISIFGSVGFVVSTVMAWVLYRSIRDSGKTVPKD